jgi:hypothetical protein
MDLTFARMIGMKSLSYNNNFKVKSIALSNFSVIYRYKIEFAPIKSMKDAEV